MPSESMTTIELPKHLRERIARGAAQEGLTAAALISELIDEHERRRRFEAVSRAYATEDPTYVEETAGWDAVAGHTTSWSKETSPRWRRAASR